MTIHAATPTAGIREQGARSGGSTRAREVGKLILGRVVFFGALLLVWQWATTATYLGRTISTPLTTAGGLVDLVTDGEFWRAVLLTLRSAVGGLLIAVVLGVALGLVVSVGPSAYRSASFVIDFLRTVPGLAILPLGILAFGPTMQLDLLMIVFSAVWPVLIQTAYAFRQLDRELLETVKTYRVPIVRRFVTVILPACAPRIATGIRIAATMALLLAVGTQLLAGSPGIGNLIAVYQQNAVHPHLYACIILTGVLGYLFNAGIKWIEAKALAWHFTPRKMEANA
jgi:ABC-type nitrate/sulfonate/bicarbonate transport system permease component